MRYALVNSQDTIDRFRDDVDPSVRVRAGFRWIPAPTVAAPTDYNPDTQVVEGPFYQVSPGIVTESYTIRDLTAQEIDARKENIADLIHPLVLTVLFRLTNRVRVLEGKQPFTKREFKDDLKGML